MVENAIPEEQFGFMKGKNTLQAVRCLLTNIQEALNKQKGKIHIVFIDYTKAFDLINRSMVMGKLEQIVGKNYITRILRNILKMNYVQIYDNVDKSEPLEQTNGVLQGDPLSPLLFNIATQDVVKTIQTEDVHFYAYADDMALASENIHNLQLAFDRLIDWAARNEFQINRKKTVTMTVKKGGRPAANDIITYGNEQLTRVSHFKYLGITLQTQGNVYTKHIQDRVAVAIIAMNTIKNIQKISLVTAMKLFHLKIRPIITYGLEIIWEDLSKKNLEDIERLKAAFLKKALALSKYTPSRLTYELAREPYFIEELRQQLLLPSTESYQNLIQELKCKKEEIWTEFYSTDAMLCSKWKSANYDLRHTMTRYATHGFHHKICSNQKFHQPDINCMCKLCFKHCDRYHAQQCKMRTMSLTKFCEV